MADATAPPITWKKWLELLSPKGQQGMFDFVAEARETRGENWIEEMRAEFPLASWIADLVCNLPAEEAYEEIKLAYSTYPVWIVKDHLLALHGRLKFEIEKKR